MAKVIKVRVNTGNEESNQLFDVASGSGDKGSPTRVKVVKGARYQLEDPSAKNVGPENIRSKRVGKNLHVMLDGSKEADLIVEDYYNETTTTDNSTGFYGRTEDGKLYEYIPEDPTPAGQLTNMADGGKPVSQVLGGPQTDEAFVLSGLVVAAGGGFSALTAGAAAAGAAALGGGGGGGGTAAVVTKPATPTSAPASYVDNVGAVQSTTSTAATTETTPGINVGTVPAGTTPSLYVDGVKVASTYDAATGTLVPTSPLPEGAHAITYTLTDAAGNESAQSPALSITVDTTAPNAPASAPANYADNVGAVQSTSSTAATTDDTTPGINVGTVPAGTTPSLYVDGTKVAATYDSAKGTLTPTTPLDQGTHAITYTLTDAAGNESAKSPAISITVDTTAPSTALALGSGVSDGATMTEATANTGVVTVTAENGATVDVTFTHGSVSVTKQITGTGAPVAVLLSSGEVTGLGDGSVSVTAVATDAAGNVTTKTTSFTLDTQAPTQPASAPTGYVDNVGAVQSTPTNLSTAATTDDNTPGIFVGKGLTDKPTLYVGGTKVDATYDSATGILTPNASLGEGDKSITYTLTDAAGNESAPSAPLSLKINTSAPAIGTVTDTWGSVLNATEAASSQTITVPTTGIENGQTVTVTLNGHNYTAQVNNGSATVTIPQTALAVLTDGSTYNYNINVANTAGTAATYTGSFTVHTTPPLTPVISGITVTSDNVVNHDEAAGTITVTGTVSNAHANDVASVTVNGTTYTGSVKTDGTFAVDVPGTSLAAANSLSVNVTATDANGNSATGTASKAYSVDTVLPDAPTNVTVVDTDGDNKPTISGVAEKGSTVTITDPNGKTYTTTADANTGAFSLELPNTPTPNLLGNYSVTARDAAGNTSASTSVNATDLTAPNSKVQITVPGGSTYSVVADNTGHFSVELSSAPTPLTGAPYTATATDAAGNTSQPTSVTPTDLTAPTAPALTLGAGVSNGATAAEATATGGVVTVKAEAGSTVLVTFKDAAGHTVTKTVTGNGTTPVAVVLTANDLGSDTSKLADGPITVTATATDAAGNTSAATTASSFTLDTTPPAAPSTSGVVVAGDNIVNLAESTATNLTVTGTVTGANTNDVVTLTVNGHSYSGTVNGSTFTVNNVAGTDLAAANSVSISITTADAAGNTATGTGTGTASYSVNTTPPAGPTLITIRDTDGDGKPNITGLAPANSTVTITAPSGETYTTTADSNGNFSTELSPAPSTLTGNYTFTSSDGTNTSAPTVVNASDLTAPQAPVFTVRDTDGDGLPTLSGTAEPNSIVKITDPAGVVHAIAVDSNGKFSLELTSAPNPLTGNYIGTATDAAGNVSLPATVNATDLTAPTVNSITPSWGSNLNAAEASQAQNIVVATTGAENGQTVTVTLNGHTYTAQVNNGSATVSVPTADLAALADGQTYAVDAKVSDAAGNTSAPTSASVSVDKTPPATPVVSNIKVTADDTVNYSESQGSINITGSVANATPSDSVSVVVGGTTYTGTIAANGTFTVAVPGSTLAANTSLSVSVTASDTNGNTATASANKTYTVDVTRPNAPTLVVADTDGDGLPNISGVAEKGSLVTITDPTGATHTVVADAATGAYSLELNPAPSTLTGNYSATATDAAGNTGTATVVNATDLTAPGAPTNLNARDTDGNGRPTVSGTAEANSTVTITDPNGQTYTTTADNTGHFVFELPNVPAPQLTGDYSFKATDAAGNTGPSSNFTATDLTAPNAPVIAYGSGVSSTNGATKAEAQAGAVSLTAEAGSTVLVTFKDAAGHTVTKTVTGNGTTPVVVQLAAGDLGAGASQLADGPITVSAIATDAAGNTSRPSTNTTFTLDTLSPVATITLGNGVSDGATVAEATASTGVLSITAENGAATTVTFTNGAHTVTRTFTGNGSAQAVTLSPADLSTLGDGNISVNVSTTDAAGNTGTSTSSFKLEAGINTIADYAETGATAPTLQDYTDAGVTGIGGTGQPSLNTINDAINHQAGSDNVVGNSNDRAGADSVAKVQAIVDAYKAIIDNANNASTTNPVQGDYAKIGVTGVDTAEKTSLLGDAIDGKSAADVDTVQEVQDLANAAAAVMAGNPTVAQLQLLGVDTSAITTPDKLATVQAVLAAKPDASIDTLSELQNVIQAALSSLAKIQAYADNATNPVPDATDYANIAVTGMGGAGQPSVTSINSALADADISAAQVPSPASVQAIVSAYSAITASADGTDNNAPNPTQTQYAAIGVNGVDTAQEQTLLGDVIDVKAFADIDTVPEVQALATAVQAVMDGNATKAQLESLGVTGVTDDNLKAVQNALLAANDATQLDTKAHLQSVVDGAVSAYNSALDAIKAAAEANTAASLTPTDYAAAGVTGVDANNVAAINDALNSGTPGAAASAAGVSGSEADTPAEIQAIVDAYNKILAEANDTNANAGDTTADATPTADPLASDYAKIGADIGGAATDAENLALLNDIVGASQKSDVDTIAEINDLARIANAIEQVAAGGTPSPALTLADLAKIGLNTTGLTNSNLPALINAIAAKADDGTATDSLAELQAIVDNLDKTAPNAPVLGYGTGVSATNAATSAEAQAGAVTVSADAGSTITVTFTDTNGHTVTKTLTNATGSAQAIALSASDLGAGASQLADGNINVSVVATDAAGNPSSAVTSTFKLDTHGPSAVADSPANLTENFSSSTGSVATNDTGLDGTETFALAGANGSGDVVGTYATLHMNSNGSYTLTANENAIHAITSNATEVFSYTVTDAAGNSSTSTVTFTFTPVNTAPVNAVPGAQTTAEDTAKVITGLGVTDVDAGSSNITVTLSVAHGTLSLSTGTGVTLGTNGTSSVTLTGKVSDINTLLGKANAVTYTPTANYNGSDTLTMTTNDGGNIGTGGALTDTDTVNFTVSAVNDAPTLTATTVTGAATSSNTPVSLFSSATANAGPSEGDNFKALSLTVGGLADGANEKLTIDGTTFSLTAGTSGFTSTNGWNYSVSVSGTTATVTLTNATGQTTTAVNTLVNGMQYSDAAAAMTSGTRTVTLTSLQDTGGTANGGVDTASLNLVSTVSVVANHAPTATQTLVVADPFGSSNVYNSFTAGATLAGSSISGNGTFAFGGNSVTVTGNTGTATASFDGVTGLWLADDSNGIATSETANFAFARAVTKITIDFSAFNVNAGYNETLTVYVNGQPYKLTSANFSAVYLYPDGAVATPAIDASGVLTGTTTVLGTQTAMKGKITITSEPGTSGITSVSLVEYSNKSAGTIYSLSATDNTSTSSGLATGSSSLATLFGSYFADVDSGDTFKGLAITSAGTSTEVSSLGKYQYSKDGGTTWTDLAAGLTDTTAVYLNKTDLMRFVATSGNTATDKPDLSVRLIDTQGAFSYTSGSTVDVSGAHHGGSTAVSNEVVTLHKVAALPPYVPQPMSVLNLTTISGGTGGFAINGSGSENSGYMISSAGDVNGDGYDDILIGAYINESYTTSGGAAYVVFGKSTSMTSVTLTDIAAGNGGFAVFGQYATTIADKVSSAGDINGDGLSDLLIDAPGADGAIGRAYVVYGKKDTAKVWTSDLDNASGGFTIFNTANNGTLASGVSIAGDVNGDGYADLIIGTGFGSSKTYVLYGKAGMGNISVSTLGNGVNGLALTGSGAATVSNAGDINGDGLSDMIVGYTQGGTNTSGVSYVVFGRTGTTSSLDLSSVVDVSGFAINGEYATDEAGMINNIGDVNGDGLADLLVGAWSSDASGTNSGRAYVVFGKTSTTAVDLSAVAAGSGGFVINSAQAGDAIGAVDGGVSGIGDINGDGLADMMITGMRANGVNGSGTGRAYVVFGKTGNAAVNLSAVIAGSGGFLIEGEAGSYLGRGSSAVGDLNGDGYADLMVSSVYANNMGGKTYVIYGSSKFITSTIGLGVGGTTDDFVVGTAGADTLVGNGGIDRFSAGAGNDTIVLTASDVVNLANNTIASTKASVDGGTGYDTLRLIGGTSMNLTAISNVGGMTGATGENMSRINEIERVDLATDTAANTLTLSARDVNDMAGMNLIHTGSTSADGKTWTNVSGTALSATTSYHQLVVDGSAADTLTLAADLGDWGMVGTVSNGINTYTVYQNALTHSQVLVQSAINVVNNDPTSGGGSVSTNNAPVLSDTVLSLSSLADTAAAPSGAVGSLVSSFMGGVTDANSSDGQGMAITGVDTTHGKLYYSLNGGTSWTQITSVSDANALLIRSDGDNRLYYQPNSGTGGTSINSAVTFRAWDQSTGTEGAYVNASTNGGTSAYSSATDTISMKVSGNAAQLSVGGVSLIKPIVAADGSVYYFVDLNGDGSATFSDSTTHQYLDNLFNGGVDTTGTSSPTAGQDTERSFVSGGYTVILPTFSELKNVFQTTAADSTWPTGNRYFHVADLNSLNANWHLLVDPANLGTTYTGSDSYAYDGVNFMYGTFAVFKVIAPVAPVVFDLNGDGTISYTQQVMDINSDGKLDFSAWAAPQDGVLVWNKFGDGMVHDASQYAFTQYGGNTDLQGLAVAFDTNHDGVLNAQDAQFGEFMVWQDTNGNGVSDAGEMHSLNSLGVTSINLVSDGVQRTPATGVTEAGHSSATLANGSSLLVADAAFGFQTLPAINLDAATKAAANTASGAPTEVVTLKASDVLVDTTGSHAVLLSEANTPVVYATAANDATLQVLIDQHAMMTSVGG